MNQLPASGIDHHGTQYYLEIKGQPSKNGPSGKRGPDRYVTVQVVPPGKARLKILNHKYADVHGIRLEHMGEGYSTSVGPRSRLWKAIQAGLDYIHTHCQ